MKEGTIGRMLRRAARSRRRRRLARIVLRTAAPLLPRKAPPTEPIFILGSPRSGTTLLFELLGRSSHVASLEAESHLLWEMFHDLPAARFSSHEVGPGDITRRERKVLYFAIDRVSVGRRYLDKAPRNCFVPLSINGYEGHTWKFIVPPGWEEYASGRSLEEVCAFQWVSANQAILAARERIGTDRWIEVGFEEFVEAPQEQAAQLLERLGLPLDPEVLLHAGSLDRHVTKAVTQPRPDKWRTENPGEIERILPMIESTMRRLGYELARPAE